MDKIILILFIGIFIGLIVYHIYESNICQIKCEEFMIEHQCICIYDNNYLRFNNSINKIYNNNE